MINFIGLANFNAISLASSGLLSSPLVQHLVGNEISHVFFSLIRGSRRSRLTRARRRKMMNRRQRWFTDNIIMHHKRLHDRNREIVVSSVRARVLAKKLAASSPAVNVERKWRDRVDTKDRGLSIRGRIDARRARARSRWLSVATTSSSASL